jgi:hypothetical protein
LDAALAVRNEARVFGNDVDAAPGLPHGVVEMRDHGAVVKPGDVELLWRAQTVTVVVEPAAWWVENEPRWRGVADHLQTCGNALATSVCFVIRECVVRIVKKHTKLTSPLDE